MRYIICGLLLCFGISTVSAQEVYNSSGHDGRRPVHHKEKKGFDPSKVIIGGSFIANFGDGFVDVGISPVLGYKFTKNFAAGIGVGYEYYKETDQIQLSSGSYQNQTSKASDIYPSLWAKYHIYRALFASASYEYNMIHYQENAYDNLGSISPFDIHKNVSCLLLGIGFKIPVSGRVSIVPEILYDVLQNQYSPYYGQSPQIRIGVFAGL